MRIKATGAPEDLDRLVKTIGDAYEILSVSKPRDTDVDVRFKRIYIEIATEDRRVQSTVRDHQVIDYCNVWRSKSDVMHNFGISFEAAEELLNRLDYSGALIRHLLEKKYVFIDARYADFVERRCGNCEHRGMFGKCYKFVEFEDVKEGEYLPGTHRACNDKFEPSYEALWKAATPENYEKIRERNE